MSIAVEFVGYAGSGKTYIKNQVIEVFEGGCDVANDIRLTAIDFAWFTIGRPATVFCVAWLVLGSRPRSIGMGLEAFRKMLLYQMKMEKARGERHPVVVFDEGMLHRIRMLRKGAIKGGFSYLKINRIVRSRLFGTADLVVLVDASLETIVRRRVARDGWKMEEGDVQRTIRSMEGKYLGSLARTEADIRFAQREHGFRFLKVVNDERGDISANMANIRREILAIAKARTGSAREEKLLEGKSE